MKDSKKLRLVNEYFRERTQDDDIEQFFNEPTKLERLMFTRMLEHHSWQFEDALQSVVKRFTQVAKENDVEGVVR